MRITVQPVWLLNNVKIYYLARVFGVAWGIHHFLWFSDSSKLILYTERQYYF